MVFVVEVLEFYGIENILAQQNASKHKPTDRIILNLIIESTIKIKSNISIGTVGRRHRISKNSIK